MRAFGGAFAGFALAGCVVTFAESTPVRGPDGGWWQYIERRSKMNCYALAANQCPSGYDIADEDRRAGPVVVESYGSATVATTRTELSMMIRCKGADARVRPSEATLEHRR